jgi:hypothetical protein
VSHCLPCDSCEMFVDLQESLHREAISQPFKQASPRVLRRNDRSAFWAAFSPEFTVWSLPCVRLL